MQRKPTLLLNPYGVDMGTGGLILQAESKKEILADKLVAFALRKNRIKYRDLWDIVWLYQNNIKLSLELVNHKIRDHKQSYSAFFSLLNRRKETLMQPGSSYKEEFTTEILRFLPADIVRKTIQQDGYWLFLVNLISEYCERISALN